MPTMIPSAALEHVDEAFEIGVDIGMRVIDRVANACLGGEVDHLGKLMLLKERLDARAIGEIKPHKGEIGVLLEKVKPRQLQSRVIVIVDDIQTSDIAPLREQPLGHVKSDEAGRPCH